MFGRDFQLPAGVERGYFVYVFAALERQVHPDAGSHEGFFKAFYFPDFTQEVQEGFHRIVIDLRERMGEGHDSPGVQARIKELHAWIGNFYDCTLDVFEGLGHGYNQDPRFREMYETNYGPGVSEFLEKAIVAYCEQQRGS